MNEHIKKLLDKALDQAVPETWTQLSHEQITKLSQVFAELIVQECLNEIQSLLDCNTQVDEFEQGVYNGLDMAKDCIKEHFGVEE